jgi:hypothetical protein
MQHKGKSGAAAGRRGESRRLCPRRRGRQEGQTDRAAGSGSGARVLHPGTPGRRGEGTSGAAPGPAGGRRVPAVPLKFAGGQESAGRSFPPCRLEREEEAGEVPPTPGAGGRREKGKGEEKRAGPGTTCGSAVWGTGAPALPAGPSRAAHPRLRAATLRSPRLPLGPGWGAARALWWQRRRMVAGTPLAPLTCAR